MDNPNSCTRRVLELRAAEYYYTIRKPENEWKTFGDLEPQLLEFAHWKQAERYDEAYQVLDLIDYDYLHLWGYYTRLIEMRNELVGRLTDSELQAKNLSRLGLACYGLEKLQPAIEHYEEAIRIFRKTGNRHGEGICLGDLGLAYQVWGKLDQAIRCYKEALSIARDNGDRLFEGIWLGYIGRAYSALGQFEVAIGLYDQAITIVREADDRREENTWLGRLGMIYRVFGQSDQALECIREALTIAQEIGHLRYEVTWTNYLGNIYLDLEQSEKAFELFSDARILAQRMGYQRGDFGAAALHASTKIAAGRSNALSILGKRLVSGRYDVGAASP